MLSKILKSLVNTITAFLVFLMLPIFAQADTLLPGNISTCGELAAPGTYTLTQNISGGSNTCLYISSDNIVINGGGYTISGTGNIAIDARAKTGGPTGTLTEGANAYTNLVINDLNISGYTTGLNMSGNDDLSGNGINSGYAGDAGDVVIYYSYIGSITANGGQSSTKSYGGIGGNIAFNDTNLNISSSTISVLGGLGTVNRNTIGGLDLNYTGTITSTNLTLSALSYFNDNAIEYGVYPGGSMPIYPGNISTCGTLYATTTSTFILTQDLVSSSTCFIIAGDNITINGSGHSLTLLDASSTAYAIDARGYSDFVFASTTVIGFSNFINSDNSVKISGYNLDISNKHIEAGSLEIVYTGLFKYKNFSFGDLDNLTVNGYNYGSLGSYTAPIGLGSIWLQRPTSGVKNWRSIASSADGTKLAAVVNINGGDYIYTSIDSGVTWTQKTGSGSKAWYDITSSADGTKLAAVVNSNDYVYTSSDGGETWIQRTDSGYRSWLSIDSSSDGSKLIAGANGYVYVSIDGGQSWTEHIDVGSFSWYGVSVSDDGLKLIVAGWGNYIYTSTNGGETWTKLTSLGVKNWRSVDSSADGSQIVAGVNGGYIYTSVDGGVNWLEQTSSGPLGWIDIDIADYGGVVSAAVNGGYIYHSATPFLDLNITVFNPTTGVVGGWSPSISWDTADNCYYSFDNWISTSTANCSSGGSDISNPGHGNQTLSLRSFNDNGLMDEINRTFILGLPIDISTPFQNQLVTSWSPVIDWDPDSLGNITLCQYSFDNWISTSTANCSLGGSDVLAPSINGTTTLQLKVTNSNNETGYQEVTFTYSPNPWVARESNRNWREVAISSDGTKLAAVVYGGYLYTSSNGGITWTEQTSAGLRNWSDVIISDDGTNISAIAWGNYIYNSTSSGATWVAKTSTGTKNWNYISGSSNGQYQAATVDGQQIWVSSDYGSTWTAKGNNRGWKKIDVSSSGQYMATVSWNGYMSYSSDYGVTWTERPQYFASGYGIAISDNGQEVAVIKQYGGQVSYSYDAGLSWVSRLNVGPGYSIDMSADGTKLLFASGGDAGTGFIYMSTDDAVSFSSYTPSGKWYGAQISSDGTKMLGGIYGGKLYTFGFSSTSISVIRPSAGVSLFKRAWNALVDWGNSVTCSYSYDNFVSSTISVDCNQNGSDILAPTNDGPQILSIRGIDSFANQVNQTASFDFEPWTARAVNYIKWWYQIVMNFDGSKILVATNNSYPYYSSDFGLSWTQLSSAGSRTWRGAAMSEDGTKMALSVNNGYIYTSTSSGATWVERTTAGSRQWKEIAMSSDGNKLVAVAANAQIYTSTDAGATWTARDSSRNWIAVTSSADGTKLAAAVSGGQIYTSTSSGATWVPQSSGSGSWVDITSSTDGTKLAAAVSGGQIYTSNNSGITWVAQNSGSRSWGYISGSADGARLVASADRVYVSNDYGVTWTVRGIPGGSSFWRAVGMSGDGTKSFAGLQDSYLYSIHSYPYIISPTSTSTVVSWNPNVNWDKSTTCEYSYDNINWDTVSCSGTGSDINQPLDTGLKTLYIKYADFQGIIATSSVTFSYFSGLTNSIDSCGVIDVPGTYNVTQDITGVSDSCFVIRASGVTINGNGHIISAAGGNTSYAVTTGNHQNLILNNISFTGFGSGLVSSNSSVTYSGTDVNVSNSTSTVGSLTINYTNTLTSVGTWLSNLTNLIINNIDLLSFVAGYFSWSQNNISACGTISTPGIYTLTQDITNISGTCFNIQTGLVIFNGNGHTISAAGGNTSYAFTATSTSGSGYSNIAIKDLTMVGFGGGINARGEDDLSYVSGIEKNNGGNVSLYNVVFPTNIVAVNTSGGDSVYEEANSYGGDAGDVKVVNSVIGSIVAHGGDSLGDINIGYDNGTREGGDAGNIYNASSTISTVNANAGLGYIPGCMVNTYDNYDANATYDDGSCTSLQVGTERDNYVGDSVSGPIDFYYYSNRGVVNGDANYYSNNFDSSIYATTTAGNIGTTTGYAVFDDQWNTCVWGNYGYVQSGALFNACSYNLGVVDGGAAFNGSYNDYSGLVNGTTTFEWSQNDGVVNGFADFAYNGSESYNYGTVNGDAKFYSQMYFNSYNYGTVTGRISFVSGCTDPNAINYVTADYDEGNCIYYGQSSDIPAGVTYTGNIDFNGYHNYGTVIGNATFEPGSYNYGTVTGTAMFNGYTSSGGIYEVNGLNEYGGTGIVGGAIYDINFNEITTFNFTNGTVNNFVLDANAVFNDNSYNNATVTGNITFNNNSYCLGNVIGDVTFNTTYYSSTIPNVGIFNIDNNDWNCSISGTVYGADNTSISRYVFNNSTKNLGKVNVDAVFNTNGYGANIPLSNRLVIHNNVWKGTILGNIYSSDGVTEISYFDFTGTSTNQTTINANTTFANSASNNGIINGDALFTNNSPFVIGTVNGSVTLNGSAQTINGINNVQNLTKNSSIRDVLFLGAGSTLNVSGLLVLNGADQNSLLTIKSTVPDSYANLNINGSATLNHLRLKDIKNNSSLIDLTNVNVFNDGGNFGFTFKINSTPGTRGGITGVFTPPVLPVSRGGVAITPSATVNNNISNASPIAVTLDRFINPNIKPIDFKPTQSFDVLNNANIGTTFIPNPLAGIKAPTMMDFIQLPTNFLTNLSKFTINALLKDNKIYADSLVTYLRNRGIDVRREQGLARLQVKPIYLSVNDNVYDTVFKLDNSYITYDSSMRSIVQKVRIPTNTYINLLSNKVKSIKYFKKDFPLFDGKIEVLSPEQEGVYIIDSTNIPLILDVYEPIRDVELQKTTIWQKIVRWTRKVFK